MALRTFDPKEVSVILGEYILRGFSDDQVSVVRDNSAYELTVGCSGEGVRTKSNDKSGTITITLQQSSPSNDDLSTLALLDETSNLGLRPFYMKDSLGTTIYSAISCFVEQIPEASYGKSATDRVWVIKTDALLGFLGGNN
jgi:hypothetical protein